MSWVHLFVTCELFHWLCGILHAEIGNDSHIINTDGMFVYLCNLKHSVALELLYLSFVVTPQTQIMTHSRSTHCFNTGGKFILGMPFV